MITRERCTADICKLHSDKKPGLRGSYRAREVPWPSRLEVRHQLHKACSVVIGKAISGLVEILAFGHRLAGKQLVTGSIEENEHPSIATVRELKEESDIANAELVSCLDEFELSSPTWIWHNYLCCAGGIEERWTFLGNDDGGHEFNFFWHDIDEVNQTGGHPIRVA